MFYAASFGGLFPMAEMKTNNEGKVILPLGKSSVYVLASKDNEIASSIFNTIDSNELTLVLN